VFVDYQRILVFDGETGIYKGYLDCTASNKQSVRAGQLCFLSQNAFTVNEEPCHRLGVDAFVLFCDISTEMVLQQRHLQCTVEVEARLRMDVFGERIVRNRDGWLLAGPISVRVHGRGADSSETLEVRVRHPAIDGDHRCAVHSTAGRYLGTDLDLPGVGDFGLARVSLHIRGQDRALYRTKFWYWPGLKRLHDERLFVTTSIPENLAEAQLSHIGRDGRGRLVLLDGEPYLRARLCFRVKRRLVSFTLAPPGASVSVRRPDGAERPLRVGASLSVRDDHASNLIVRYSDPMAAIDLKGEIIPAAFGKAGIWRVSFAALKQEGKHNRVRLLSDREPNSHLDLVRVVPEAEPSFFRAQQLDERLFVEAGFERPIDAVRIDAENLITGKRLDAEVALTFPPSDTDGTPLVTVFPTTSSSHLRLGITQDNYGDGIWFVHLQVLEHGRKDWFPIIDSSGDSYATCIAPNDYVQRAASEDVSDWCPEAHRNQAFLRLSRTIETPIARPCRPNVVNLALSAWRRLGEALDTRHPSDRAALLKACALPPPPHARETWMPVHHPVEVASALFAIPAEDIGELASTEQPGYEEFESVGLAGITQSLQEAVEVLDVSTTFLIGFKGASTFHRDPTASPGDFDFSKYCGFARTIEQMADDDKPLSIWHHDRACERMADRVRIASRDRFSSARLYKATTIVRHYTRNPSEGLDIPHDLLEGFPLVKGAPRLLAALTRAWRNGDAEKFWEDLAFTVSWPVERVRKHVGTILRLAPELLAFYLLLWVLVERHERV